MPALVCPHCGTYSNFTHRWSSPLNDDIIFATRPDTGHYTCDRCELPIAALHDSTGSRGLKVYWPTRASGKTFLDVPGLIAAAASDAHTCLSAGSPRGAVAIARSVVEAVAKDKGICNGNLKSKIEALLSAGYISEAMKEAADEIRFAGNEAAHGDLVAEQLTLDDADEIVGLMDTMLERVYQEPAQIARIRAKREGRNSPAPTPVEDTSDEPPF